jgi:hypothetical protein
MADIYIQGSFAFTCHADGAELLVQACDTAMALRDEVEPDTLCAALIALFPPHKPDDPWSGLLSIFDDPDFPDFGADLQIDVDPDNQDTRIVVFCGKSDFQPAPIAALIQRCCARTLAQAPIGFEWAEVCSRPRVGHFSGGWCAIFPDRLEFESTHHALTAALGGDVI